jgi:hypothetical protein
MALEFRTTLATFWLDATSRAHLGRTSRPLNMEAPIRYKLKVLT